MGRIHRGGGHYSGGKANAMAILFVILANNGSYCQLRCLPEQVDAMRSLFLEKAKHFGYEVEIAGNFIYVGTGKIEIAVSDGKLKGEEANEDR